jgi:LysR family glycine cleavage system transcriptional activator
MWLCNHIASFHEQYPNLSLQIVTGGELDQATDRDADLFIVFGEGTWLRHTVQHLYDVEFLPLCSPALQNMQGGLGRPADVLRYPLLHLRQTDEWRQWLAASQVELPRARSGVIFSDLMLVQTAAIAGQGIMMGDEITCAEALAAGQLVAPLPTKIKARGGYYLLRSRQRRQNPAIGVHSLAERSVHAGRHGAAGRPILRRGRGEPKARPRGQGLGVGTGGVGAKTSNLRSMTEPES